MKNLLLSLLLLSSLCSFKKEKPEAAVKKGSLTTIVSVGYPSLYKLSYPNVSVGPFIAGVEYQASRRFTSGLQYSCNYAATGMLPVKNYFSGTDYQRERRKTWNVIMATADICYLNRGRISLGSGIGIGMLIAKSSEHVIDSIGISTHSAYVGKELALRVRLVNVKVRITKNFGFYGGFGYGSDGIVAAGAHYTFAGRKDKK